MNIEIKIANDQLVIILSDDSGDQGPALVSVAYLPLDALRTALAASQ